MKRSEEKQKEEARVLEVRCITLFCISLKLLYMLSHPTVFSILMQNFMALHCYQYTLMSPYTVTYICDRKGFESANV